VDFIVPARVNAARFGGFNLIPVAVVRDIQQAIPVRQFRGDA